MKKTMMKKLMMLMLFVAAMGMGLQSCSKEESSIQTGDDRTYDTELEVTRQDLIKYELIMGDFDNLVRYFLFKDNKAAYLWHDKSLTPKTNFIISRNWTVADGKLKMVVEKDGQTETLEYGVSKMYKRETDGYLLQILIKDDEGYVYVFYAKEDGSKHQDAENWWDAISN